MARSLPKYPCLDGIMVSDGGVMGSGSYFKGTGIMVSDGVVLGDGIMVSDNVRAQQAMVEGDPTACMSIVVNPGL